MSKHAYKCCINGCSSKGSSSHRFPNPKTNLFHFQKWIRVIGGDIETMYPSVVYSKKRVCSDHFTLDDQSPGTNKLKCNVVPKLNVIGKTVVEAHVPVESPVPNTLQLPPAAEIEKSMTDLNNLSISGIEIIGASSPSKQLNVDLDDLIPIQEVCKFLHEKGVKSILLRNFNQDSLENMFGAIRALGYRNNNPTCYQFASSYRTLLLNNLMSAHSPGGNCEEDLGTGSLMLLKILMSWLFNR